MYVKVYVYVCRKIISNMNTDRAARKRLRPERERTGFHSKLLADKITVLNHERSSKQGEQQKICEPISNLGTSLLVNKSNRLKDK